jgi:hypothetical protein
MTRIRAALRGLVERGVGAGREVVDDCAGGSDGRGKSDGGRNSAKRGDDTVLLREAALRGHRDATELALARRVEVAEAHQQRVVGLDEVRDLELVDAVVEVEPAQLHDPGVERHAPLARTRCGVDRAHVVGERLLSVGSCAIDALAGDPELVPATAGVVVPPVVASVPARFQK